MTDRKEIWVVKGPDGFRSECSSKDEAKKEMEENIVKRGEYDGGFFDVKYTINECYIEDGNFHVTRSRFTVAKGKPHYYNNEHTYMMKDDLKIFRKLEEILEEERK